MTVFPSWSRYPSCLAMEPRTAPWGPEHVEECSCFFPVCRFNQKWRCACVPEAHTERTLTWLVAEIITNKVLLSIPPKCVKTDSHFLLLSWQRQKWTQNAPGSQRHTLMDALSTGSISIWCSCPDPRPYYLSHVSLTHWSVHFCAL